MPDAWVFEYRCELTKDDLLGCDCGGNNVAFYSSEGSDTRDTSRDASRDASRAASDESEDEQANLGFQPASQFNPEPVSYRGACSMTDKSRRQRCAARSV
jgi:predicted  nucleic acid-binding Zn-ribbon protein